MHPQTKTRRHTRCTYSRSVAVYFACTTGPHGTGAARRSRRNLLNLASHSHLSRCATARARRRMPSLLYALQLYSTVSRLLADPTRHTSTYTPSGSRPRISEVSSRVVLTWRWRGWRAARGYRGHQTLHHWPSSGPPRSAHDRSPCRRLPPSPSCWPCAALAVKVRVPR